MIAKPTNLDPTVYFKSLIDILPETDLLDALENTKTETLRVLSSVPIEKENYAYAEGKWTIKQLAQHIVDCERILNYRALSVARKEPGKLLGFDEGFYVQNDLSHNRTIKEICEEFELVRNSTIALVKSFHPDILDHPGNANGVEVTPRIVSWFTAGHGIHHINVMKERYLG